ncbi:glycerol-3-phosphate 2-O-acyltransferase 6 [Panicum miliaceum]|uniref:Glycerol-3-phosphate 2-O-acyltransferase 6 n=1 Tax=Panicum miliaceum TaxID=4540 RepID=A0A3L6R7Z8_PANMI|nr:glycerol-3-phosphate 2-O-acyltransferase 6 [Panicum miliaceum]
MVSRRFNPVEQCACEGRSRQAVAADLDSTLLLSRSAFPYYLLIALEAGGPLRAAAVLLSVPLVYLTYVAMSEPLAVRALLYVAVAGFRAADVEAAARSVLPRFYAGDVHPEGWRVFRSFGRRCVVTASPRVMVEPFAKAFLGADVVIGTELEVSEDGVLVGEHKRRAVEREFGDAVPDVGMGDRESDFNFMSVCKEAYIVTRQKYRAVPREQLRSRAVLHDGHLARRLLRPTATSTLLTFLCVPLGFALALLRARLHLLLPPRAASCACKLTGVKLVVRGHPPPPPRKGRPGVLFVCNHRTAPDPVALGRKVSCFTDSGPRFPRLVSLVRATVAPSGRVREADAARLLEFGDVVIFPEGATCREPFLLRFGALFAELTDRVVPLAINARESMFHGSTARGDRSMDPYFFFMNPRPTYEVTFLNQLPRELTCGGDQGRVANYV